MKRLFKNLFGTKRMSRLERGSVRLSVEALEGRELMAANLPVPALASKPDAPASLYLDFDGHTQPCWGKYIRVGPVTVTCSGETDVRTPAFDLDGNLESYSSTELAKITEVWQRVAEDFAPFNLNVTTVVPSSFADKKGMRIAIGGHYNDWYGDASSGVAYVASFMNSLSNTAYVFSKYIGSNAAWIASTISHEAGHSFGLHHQSLYNANGQLVDEYNPGVPGRVPLMGNNLSTDRTIWHRGTTSSATTIQDDMNILTTKTGFTYRTDDHSDTFSGSHGMIRLGDTLTGSGIIATMTDKDVTSFMTRGGQVSMTLNVAAVGANLDAKLELYERTQIRLPNGLVREGYRLVVSSAPTNSLGASISANVAAGTYYVVASSQGGYGDVGQYTLTGSAPRVLLPPGGGRLAGADVAVALVLSNDEGQAVEPTFTPIEASASPATVMLSQVDAGRNDARAVDHLLATSSRSGSWSKRKTDSVDALAAAILGSIDE